MPRLAVLSTLSQFGQSPPISRCSSLRVCSRILTNSDFVIVIESSDSDLTSVFISCLGSLLISCFISSFTKLLSSGLNTSFSALGGSPRNVRPGPPRLLSAVLKSVLAPGLTNSSSEGSSFVLAAAAAEALSFLSRAIRSYVASLLLEPKASCLAGLLLLLLSVVFNERSCFSISSN